jgi:hypothetical protein
MQIDGLPRYMELLGGNARNIVLSLFNILKDEFPNLFTTRT